MRRHVVVGEEIVRPLKSAANLLPIVRHHHERVDGAGYPDGLRGDAIPLAARIFAVTDVWDALRCKRPYRNAWTPAQAREYIDEQAGRHFDPQIVEVFLRMEREGQMDLGPVTPPAGVEATDATPEAAGVMTPDLQESLATSRVPSRRSG